MENKLNLGFGPEKLKESIEEIISEFCVPPVYDGEMNLVADVGQREYAISRFDAKKPILATYGLAGCIGLTGFNKERRVGFLAHYDALTDLKQSFPGLLFRLYKAGCEDGDIFEVELIGENYCSGSIELGEKLRNLARYGNLFKMNVAEINSERAGSKRESVALDCRNGEMYSYNPMKNPFREELSEIELRIQSLRIQIEDNAKLIYAPE